MSVFQVGIGFSVYRSVFVEVGSVLLSVFKISRYRFSIFGIVLCVKAPCADPKILLPSQFADFVRNFDRVAAAGRRSIRTSVGLLPVAEGVGELSSLDTSNPEELILQAPTADHAYRTSDEFSIIAHLPCQAEIC